MYLEENIKSLPLAVENAIASIKSPKIDVVVVDFHRLSIPNNCHRI